MYSITAVFIGESLEWSQVRCVLKTRAILKGRGACGGGQLPWWRRHLRICLQCERPEFDFCVGKIPWRRAWQCTPVFLPGESPWAEEPGGLQSMGSQRLWHDWATKHTLEREEKSASYTTSLTPAEKLKDRLVVKSSSYRYHSVLFSGFVVLVKVLLVSGSQKCFSCKMKWRIDEMLLSTWFGHSMSSFKH